VFYLYGGGGELVGSKILTARLYLLLMVDFSFPRQFSQEMNVAVFAALS
jgi:hypothetical protein